MPALTKSTQYRSFIHDRDLALEKFNRDTQKKISDLAKNYFDQVLFLISHRLHFLNGFNSRNRQILDGLYAEIDHRMRMLAMEMAPIIQASRKQVTYLAFAGEVEAIGRALTKPYVIDKPDYAEDPEHVIARMYYLLKKIADKICEEIEHGYVMEKKPAEIYDKVLTKLPKVNYYKKPPRELKPLQEAATLTSKVRSATKLNFVDDEEWQNIVKAYKDEYIPKNRSLEFDVEIKGEEEAESWYGWEIEKELTNDFLQRVKDGLTQAGDETGIDDLLWVAILDNKTRDEHRLKDGLTSTEIESKLDNEWSDFEDDSTVAPSDGECRCRSVPYVKDLPESQGIDYAGFNQWLNG